MKRISLMVMVMLVTLFSIPSYAAVSGSQIRKGTFVTFGRWGGSELTWQVLKNDGEEIVLMTADILRSGNGLSFEYNAATDDAMGETKSVEYKGASLAATKPFNSQLVVCRKGTDNIIVNSYVGSQLQKWINETNTGFEQKAFNSWEKTVILPYQLTDIQYPSVSTEVKAYILSQEEALDYGVISKRYGQSISTYEGLPYYKGLTSLTESMTGGKEDLPAEDVFDNGSYSKTDYENYVVEAWWLRTPSPDCDNEALSVEGSRVFSRGCFYLETGLMAGKFMRSDNDVWRGIRPCINMDADKVEIISGKGTNKEPYKLAGRSINKKDENKVETNNKADADNKSETDNKAEADNKVTEDDKANEPVQNGQQNEDEPSVPSATVEQIKELEEYNGQLITNPEKINVSFYLNDKKVSLSEAPVMSNGTTYLPVRAVAQLLGIDVIYKDGVVNIYQGQSFLQLPIGYTHVIKNGEIIAVDESDAGKGIPCINGVSYIPLRFLASHLGYEVTYHNGGIYINQ